MMWQTDSWHTDSQLRLTLCIPSMSQPYISPNLHQKFMLGLSELCCRFIVEYFVSKSSIATSVTCSMFISLSSIILQTPEEYMGQVINHMGGGGICEIPPPDMQQAIPVVSGWMNSSSSPSSTTGSVPYQSASSTPSPPAIAVSVGYNNLGGGAAATAAPCPLGVPFYPVWIPGKMILVVFGVIH